MYFSYVYDVHVLVYSKFLFDHVCLQFPNSSFTIIVHFLKRCSESRYYIKLILTTGTFSNVSLFQQSFLYYM